MKFEKTGKIRCPLEDEWFDGGDGFPKQALFDFTVQEFPILRLVEKKEKEPKP